MGIVLPDFTNPAIATFFTVYFVAVGLAALFGSQPERLAALIFLLIPALQSMLYSTVVRPIFSSLDWALLAVDIVAIVGLSVIAYNANRFWPARAVGFLVLSALSHLIRAIWPMLENSYAHFNFIPTLAAVWIVAAGAIYHRVKKLRGADEHSWVDYKKQAEIRRILGMV